MVGTSNSDRFYAKDKVGQICICLNVMGGYGFFYFNLEIYSLLSIEDQVSFV
jgi:hypothetical protein